MSVDEIAGQISARIMLRDGADRLRPYGFLRRHVAMVHPDRPADGWKEFSHAARGDIMRQSITGVLSGEAATLVNGNDLSRLLNNLATSWETKAVIKKLRKVA